MKVRACTEDEARSLNVNPYWYGFKIPYFALDGKERTFFRYRLDQDRPRPGWQKKEPKYVQPANSGSAAYLAPMIKWPAVSKDADQPVGITEGELKAACACGLGVPVIGLGGVWNWRAADMPVNGLLPELEEFVWEKRQVTIIYDSDIETKPQVRYAAARLSDVLTARGALVRLTHPPANADPSKKTGLDDWLYELPADADKSSALIELINTAPQVENNVMLHALNQEVVRVLKPLEYVELSTGRTMTSRELVNESKYGGWTYKTEDYTGEVKLKPVVKTWLTWAHCRTLKSYAYAPGAPRITEDGYYNTWSGLGVLPRDGDVTPFLWLVKRLMPEDDLRTWFMQWLAAPLQTLGLKLQNCAVLWDLDGGTGKTLIADTLEVLYGHDNFGRIDSGDFGHRFNAGIANKQFIVGDETSSSEKRRATEALKKLVTSKRIKVENKGKDVYTTDDHANFMLFTNYPNAYHVADKERRMFIYQILAPELTLKESTYYTDWQDRGGAAALLHHLQHLDMTGFSPYVRPPMTEAKEAARELSHNEVRKWIEEVKNDPIGYFGGEWHLHTVDELVKMYNDQYPNSRSVTAQWMGTELANANCKRVMKGAPIIRIGGEGVDTTRKGGKMSRVYVIGAAPDEERKWLNARLADVQEYVDLYARSKSSSKKFEAQAPSPLPKDKPHRGVPSRRISR